MIMKRPKPAEPSRPPKQRQGAQRPLSSALVLLGLLLLAVAAGGIYLATRDDEQGAGAAGGDAVTLSGVGAYDPDGGDGGARRSGRPRDGRQSGDVLAYSTYRSQLSAFKPGVGLVLEASGTPKQIAVTTDTPGFTAEIRAGNSPQGPFETVAGGKVVEATTTWDLDSTDAQYYVALDHPARRQRPRQRGESRLGTVTMAGWGPPSASWPLCCSPTSSARRRFGDHEDPERTRVLLERFYDAMTDEITVAGGRSRSSPATQ